MPRQPCSRDGLALFALLLGAYLAASSFRIETIDTGVRLEVARSLVERSSPDIAPMKMATPFGVIGSFPGRDGRFYSVYGLGTSLLMIPCALAGRPWDAHLATLLNPLASAATCVFLFLIATRCGFSRRSGIRLALLAGLATLMFPQAKFTFEAPIDAFLLTASFLFLMSGGIASAAGAGALLGFAILMRPTALLMLPGMLVLLLGVRGERFKRLAFFAASTVPEIALSLWYNWYRWGSPFATGYALTRFQYFEVSFRAFVGLVASPGRGFFWYSPILGLAFPGFRPFRERAPLLARAILVTVATYVTFFSFTTIWNGDWTWGPRHLLPLVPLVALFLLPLLEPGRLRRSVAVPLVAASVAVQLIGVTVNYETYFLWHNDWIRRHGLRERAGDYHFGLRTAQVHVEARQAMLFLSELPQRMAEFDRSQDDSPYEWILDGSPRIIKRVPDFWWIYFPMIGVPWSCTAALAAVCLGLSFGGALALARRPGG